MEDASRVLLRTTCRLCAGAKAATEERSVAARRAVDVTFIVRKKYDGDNS